jgi:hypothetical protein
VDDKFKEILDGLPEKPQRSCLAPYRDFIDELRRRGLTYREIAGLLSEKFQLHVAFTTIIRFVHARSRARRKPGSRHTAQDAVPVELAPSLVNRKEMDETKSIQGRPIDEEIQQRIAALKLRPRPAQTISKQFRYDPSEPLRLPPKTSR